MKSPITLASTKRSKVPLIRDAQGNYVVTRRVLSADDILATADQIIEERFFREARIQSSADALAFLRAKLIPQEREHVGCLFLDQRHRLIAWEILFVGSIGDCAIYPREVVKRALFYNSGALILAHQHPSGDPEPSRADKRMTRHLKVLLAELEIELLDHVVIGARRAVSLAERDDG